MSLNKPFAEGPTRSDWASTCRLDGQRDDVADRRQSISEIQAVCPRGDPVARVEKFVHPGVTYRVTPEDPGTNCVSYRMGIRGTTEQMPPFATEVVDSAGKAQVDAWIASLPH